MAKVEQGNLTNRQKKELEAQKKLKKTISMVLGGIAIFVVIVALIYFIPRLGVDKKASAGANTGSSTAVAANSDYARETDPIATITMSDDSVIKVQLYPEAAPNTVANFVELANSGFYDGLTFHRVISGFMIQGGDPTGTGMGGPGYSIKGEFTQNGVDNHMTHTRGVISMARSSDFDSAGSQFFIMHKDSTYLDGQYAAFGEVIEGMDAVDAIAGVQTDSGDKPLEDVVIKSITVDTKGIEYTAEKIEK